MRIIPKIMLCVTLTVPLASCAIDVGKLAADMKRPSVTFESPESWACNEQMKIPTGSSGVVEDCSVCHLRENDPT